MGRQACSVLGWLSPHGALTRPSRTALQEGRYDEKMPRAGALGPGEEGPAFEKPGELCSMVLRETLSLPALLPG